MDPDAVELEADGAVIDHGLDQRLADLPVGNDTENIRTERNFVTAVDIDRPYRMLLLADDDDEILTDFDVRGWAAGR